MPNITIPTVIAIVAIKTRKAIVRVRTAIIKPIRTTNNTYNNTNKNNNDHNTTKNINNNNNKNDNNNYKYNNNTINQCQEYQ